MQSLLRTLIQFITWPTNTPHCTEHNQPAPKPVIIRCLEHIKFILTSWLFFLIIYFSITYQSDSRSFKWLLSSSVPPRAPMHFFYLLSHTPPNALATNHIIERPCWSMCALSDFHHPVTLYLFRQASAHVMFFPLHQDSSCWCCSPHWQETFQILFRFKSKKSNKPTHGTANPLLLNYSVTGLKI
jgi:hypothetical protein